MLSKELIEQALNNGANFEEVWMFLTNTTLQQMFETKRYELEKTLLTLEYKDDAQLVTAYREKKRQLHELISYLEFRAEFIRQRQQPQEQ